MVISKDNCGHIKVLYQPCKHVKIMIQQYWNQSAINYMKKSIHTLGEIVVMYLV